MEGYEGNSAGMFAQGLLRFNSADKPDREAKNQGGFVSAFADQLQQSVERRRSGADGDDGPSKMRFPKFNSGRRMGGRVLAGESGNGRVSECTDDPVSGG